jgi:hypothetical protein
MKSNFRDTVNFPTRFLGINADYPHLKEETKFVPCKIIKGEHHKLLFQVHYQGISKNNLGQSETFTAEQVVAAYLNKLRNIIN